MLAYWLLGLTPVVAVAYIVWRHRKKSVALEASRGERLAQLMGKEPPRGQAAAPAADPAPGPAAAEKAPSDPEGAGAIVEGYGARQKLFSPPHAVMFYALKSSLPEYEVLAHVSLAALLEPQGEIQNWERERRRRALAPHVFDCVICSKDMRVVAAIDIVPADLQQPVFKAQCLERVGVRYVRVDPKRMPKRQDVRELILGGGG